MNKICPNPNCACPGFIIRDGTFYRRDDSKLIQRYRCKTCGTRFSNSTFTSTFKQKKRRINSPLLKLLSSGVSVRRSALLLGVTRGTIERKLPFLAKRCRTLNERKLQKLKGRVFNMQMDDLITKENSKLKPLSVSIAVDEDRRLILGAEVSEIPAFGHLAKQAVKKYGKSKDEHQSYPRFISAHLPKAKHMTFPSERGCVVGQGELKKVNFDPLFIVNHTCAMMRANINRLIRKTWCTPRIL